MALDKLVDSTQLDADLTTVANAIRTKGGTSAQLAFPAGFKSAIEAIPTGGGETYPDLTDAPIPEGYQAVCYAVVDASPQYPHTSSGNTSTNMTGIVERGTLNNGMWTAISSTAFSGSPNLDWTDTTSGFVIFRFLLTKQLSSNTLLNTFVPAVAIKISSETPNTITAGGLGKLKQYILEGSLNYTSTAALSGGIYTSGLSRNIEEIDLSNLTITISSTGRLFYNALSYYSHLKSFKLKSGTPINYTYPNFVNVFSSCASLEELDLSMIRLVGTSASLSGAFNGCYSLHTLDMSDWGNLSFVTNVSDTWGNCYMLENVNFDGTTFPAVALSFASSYRLTDTSLVSIANALPVSNKTLTLHATPKARLSAIMGTVADGVFTADESGDTTLLSFINDTKGWTVA